MEGGYGYVKLKVIQVILSLVEFTTDQVSRVTEEKRESVQTLVSRFHKDGLFYECGKIRGRGPGRPKSVYRLSSTGIETLKNEYKKLEVILSLSTHDAMALNYWNSQLSIPTIALANNRMFPAFQRYLGEIMSGFESPTIRYGLPEIGPIQKLREIYKDRLPKAGSFEELNSLRAMSQDYLSTAAIELGLDPSEGPTNDEQNIIYGFLLEELGKMILACGSVYLELALDLNEIEMISIDKWEKGYLALEDSINIFKDKNIMTIHNEVKLISKKFEKSLKVFANQKPALTRKSEIANYDKHWKMIDSLVSQPLARSDFEVVEFFQDQEVERHMVIAQNGSFFCDL